MRCPACQSDDIELSSKSAPVERLDAFLRHYHARCRECAEILWWTGPVGATDAIARTGDHECAFFRPPPV